MKKLKKKLVSVCEYEDIIGGGNQSIEIVVVLDELA
jgi:hypothetical protein